MHHIVQNCLFSEFGHRQLLLALEEENIPYTLVDVIPFVHEPFVHELQPDVLIEGPVMVWGAITLGHIAKAKGWKPGIFQNDNFDMRVHHEKFGRFFLNSDAIFCTFGELKFKGLRFCRPLLDSKSFTGEVLDGDFIEEWKEKVIPLSNDGFVSLTSDTMVMHSSPKHLDAEARFFVVDGEVITGSTYRTFGRQRMYQLIDSANPAMMDLWNFAKMMTCLWRPACAFVLDVGMSDEGPKVIEINTLNSAGFYACNMRSVVRALENLSEDQWTSERLSFS